MKKVYYLLLALLIAISVSLVAILVVRANQTDQFFEKQSYESN